MKTQTVKEDDQSVRAPQSDHCQSSQKTRNQLNGVQKKENLHTSITLARYILDKNIKINVGFSTVCFTFAFVTQTHASTQ